MATVQTDLVDLSLAEAYSGDASGVGGTWTVIGGAGGTGAGVGVDFAMQGSFAIDGKISNSERGPAITLNTAQTTTTLNGVPQHYWVWGFCATTGITETIQNRGATVAIGTGTNNNYVQYHVNGNDTFDATKKLGRCYPVDYTVRTTNTSPPYRTVSGTPGASPDVFGFVCNITANSKGINVATDAIRKGLGVYVTAGTSGSPATFSEVATANDTINNRWGLFTSEGGAAYSQQGVFYVGRDNAQTATQAYFEDSGVAVTFTDTPHSDVDLTQIRIDHASTTCKLTSCSFSAEGTRNRGVFFVETANPTVELTGCTFNNTGFTTLQSNSTVSSTTFSGSRSVTQNGATIDGCTFRSPNALTSRGAIIADTESAITNCTFIQGSSVASHAIEGFATAGPSAGSPVVYDISSNTFDGYDGTLGNEALRITATSGFIEINCADINTTFVSAGATVTIVAGQVTTTVTTLNAADFSVVDNARVYLVADTGGPLAQGTEIINGLTNASGVITDTRSIASNQPVTGYARKSSPGDDLFKSTPLSGTIDSNNGASLTALMVSDE